MAREPLTREREASVSMERSMNGARPPSVFRTFGLAVVAAGTALLAACANEGSEAGEALPAVAVVTAVVAPVEWRDTVEALWSLLWKGIVTNDSLHGLRAFLVPESNSRRARRASTGKTLPGRISSFRSRRAAPPAAAGRWSLVEDQLTGAAKPTERATALGGLALGLVTGRWLNGILKAFPGLPATIDFFLFQPRAAVVALGLLVVAGLAAGAYPAWRAASLPIARTLREEAVA